MLVEGYFNLGSIRLIDALFCKFKCVIIELVYFRRTDEYHVEDGTLSRPVFCLYTNRISGACEEAARLVALSTFLSDRVHSDSLKEIGTASLTTWQHIYYLSHVHRWYCFDHFTILAKIYFFCAPQGRISNACLVFLLLLKIAPS